MSVRFTAKARRGIVALTAAAGLVIGVAGCSGGDGGGDDKKPDSTRSASRESGSNPSAQEGQSETPLAELKGSSGLILQITSAQRDSAGGFVTVSGNIKNDGAQRITIPPAVRGDETEILRHGMSLGGATLIDGKEKKRYYVLRDTDGRPLTTTGFSSIRPGESVAVFMQFPAPPTSTTDVTFQLPTFASGTIQVSG
ncbi:hypothetical protein [Streptomyces griseosporeus]|uniref:hypothetical protein n=1 Tax=Streptomyces griseosporeus TaxID=1910 RepID=UPI00167EF2F3|nr:hypothetical protein [Streptomyces griseosporeus]GHF64378.1 hypothetical protein GCM10018783_37300 [Streptomyces griseosporeus]